MKYVSLFLELARVFSFIEKYRSKTIIVNQYLVRKANLNQLQAIKVIAHTSHDG